ncbi:uncharacterized protein LOC127732620 [Mytilus californianus]|uniref:uncharacterized protein LOC127732620 n=1 Tax=Mytilus californianus TaxID=6549 RepID=UPI0022487023|nr:uncharacterized protein LOC127732620 [Mytilus californianus]
MEMFRISFVLSLVLTGSLAQFSPTLTVDSCTKSNLKLTLNDAAQNGIIYIQGQGAACKQLTTTGSNTHEFNFVACGIAWESSFKIIVQKKQLYQTGDDKQIPIMCLADLTDISLSGDANNLDKDDDIGQNLTVKPTAFMKLYSNGVDVTGGNVKLTDMLTLTMELDAEYLQDFDIKAKYCTASTIPIIENSCATDTELFPEYAKPAQGYLSATFGAFRTTDLNGGSVPMTFTCSLQVCLGSCSVTTCQSGENGFGRKRRDVMDVIVSGSLRQKRGADDNSPFDDINVGSTLRIIANDVVIEDDDGNDNVCMNKLPLILGLIAFIVAILSSAAAVVYLYRKLRAQTELKASNNKC